MKKLFFIIGFLLIGCSAKKKPVDHFTQIDEDFPVLSNDEPINDKKDKPVVPTITPKIEDSYTSSPIQKEHFSEAFTEQRAIIDDMAESLRRYDFKK